MLIQWLKLIDKDTILIIRKDLSQPSMIEEIKISIKMEPPMLGTGKMTYNRDREKRFGLRAHGTRVIMLKARNSASASTPGPTALFTKDIGEITKSMASVNTFGKTADGTTATGRTTICQAMASTSTQTA